MRAAHPGVPVVESENVIAFAPGFRLSDFCQANRMRAVNDHCISFKLTSWSDDNRSVFANFFSFLTVMVSGTGCIVGDGKATGVVAGADADGAGK